MREREPQGMAESPPAKLDDLTGRQKAAILLVSLGPEIAGEIFRHLHDDDIERLTLEIANLQKVAPELQDAVFDEFVTMMAAQEHIATGGMEYARDILEEALGAQRAAAMLQKLTATGQGRPFNFARKTDATQLLNFIQNEHPQTIALILAHLHADQASHILSSLAPELQVEVARRLANLDQTSPEVIQEIEGALEAKLSAFVSQDLTMAGGIDVAVDVLNRVDRGTEKRILDTLEADDPELAEELRKRMFVFENIALLTDRDLRTVLQEIDAKDLPCALKTASDEVSGRIFRNMSKRQGELVREEMEFLGPVRLKDVEDAQQRIVATIRRLEELDQIIVSRGGEEDMVV